MGLLISESLSNVDELSVSCLQFSLSEVSNVLANDLHGFGASVNNLASFCRDDSAHTLLISVSLSSDRSRLSLDADGYGHEHLLIGEFGFDGVARNTFVENPFLHLSQLLNVLGLRDSSLDSKERSSEVVLDL